MSRPIDTGNPDDTHGWDMGEKWLAGGVKLYKWSSMIWIEPPDFKPPTPFHYTPNCGLPWVTCHDYQAGLAMLNTSLDIVELAFNGSWSITYPWGTDDATYPSRWEAEDAVCLALVSRDGHTFPAYADARSWVAESRRIARQYMRLKYGAAKKNPKLK